MGTAWTIDVIWWITAVELPALASLYWLIWRTRQDADLKHDATRHHCDESILALREALAAYKLEVAKSYASIPYLKEVERRLTQHLIRIENKLDGVPPSGRGGGR